LRDVLGLVQKWRTLHQQSKEKISLAEAAKKIGVSKKSLDDYLMNLKYAKSYGFDFNNNLQYGFGLVRSFVRKYKGVESASISKKSDGALEEDEIVKKVSPSSKKIAKLISIPKNWEF